MTIHIEKKPSRFRTRRIAKRGVTILLFIIAGVVAAFSIILYGATSEAFWRRYIFPQVFGPYWDTALRWEKFEANLFPPGATLQNVELVEPGANERPLLRVKDLQLKLAAGSRFSRIEVERTRIEGVDVNLVVYAIDDTNLTRIVRRLFEGKNPSAPPSSLPRDNDIIPYILLSKFDIADVNFHVSDRRYAPSKVELDFTATEPVRFQFTDPDDTSTTAGRLDKFTSITGVGNFTARVDEFALDSKGNFSIDVPDLGKFPNTIASVAATLRPARGGDERIIATFDLPLARVPLRIRATPVSNLDLKILNSEGGESWLHISKTDFDPLSGDISSNIAIKGAVDEITACLKSFSPKNNSVALDALISSYMERQQRTGNSKPVEVEVAASITGKGLNQYAIVDASERVPLKLATNGIIITRNVPVESLARLQELLAGIGEREQPPGKTFIGDLRYSFFLTADETAQQATLRADMQARPAGALNDDLLFTMSLVDANDPSEPVTFNPFQAGSWNWRLPAVADFQSDVPIYPIFPNYEQINAEAMAYLNRGTEAINALGLHDASLRQKVSIKDSAALQAILKPLLADATGASLAEMEMKATQRAGNLPSEWSADFRLNDVSLQGVSHTFSAEGRAGFTRAGSILTASDLQVKVVRHNVDGSGAMEFSLGLPRSGRDGELGPATSTYLNLATGEAHFELFANTVRREFMEMVMRIQTFGLSEELAKPFYQRVLTAIGFQPGVPGPDTQADVYLSGDIGETIRIGSLLKVHNIPAAHFVKSSSGDGTANDEEFDVRFAQAFALNRATKMLTPEEFQLELFKPQNDSPFARLSIETAPGTWLDYAALQSAATPDIDKVVTEGIQPQSLKALASTVFARASRLREAVRGNGGKIVFSIPGIQLGEWRNALMEHGIPIEAGFLKVQIESELGEVNSGTSESRSTGNLTVQNLKLTGSENVIPQVLGTLEMTSSGNNLTVQNLEADLNLDPAYPPSKVLVDGSAEIDSFASRWRLRVLQANRSALNVLNEMSESGVAAATQLLSRLPTGQLAEVAGKDARIDLEFEGETPESGNEISLRGRQTGEGINFLPAVFNPLSFESSGQIVYAKGKQFTVQALSGEVTESGTASPLLTFALSQPGSMNTAANAAESTITIVAKKSLTDISERLSRFPLPFFERTVTEGNIEGEVVIQIPKEPGAKSASDFRLELSGLKLSGFAKVIEGTISGTIEAGDDLIALKNSVMDARVDGESAGRIEINSVYAAGTKNLESVVDAIDVNSRLLEALPAEMAVWARQTGTRLNMHAEFDAGLDDRSARASLQARVRDFGVQPIQLESGGAFTPPPLNLDFELTSAFDRETSTLLLQDFSALIAKGNYPAAGRMEPLPADAQGLFRATQMGTIVFDAGRRIFSATTLAGAGMRAELGPVDLGEYGLVLKELAGIPIVNGVLTGDATIVAAGAGPTRVESGRGELRLAYGTWEKNSGETFPIEASLLVLGGHRERAFRLDHATATIAYPEAKVGQTTDSISAVGYYTRIGAQNRREFELDVTSPGLQLDRVIGLAADIQKNNARPSAIAPPPSSSVETGNEIQRYELTSVVPKNLTATITGQFDNMSFKEVLFPDTSFKGTYRNGRILLNSLRSQVSEGEISMSGSVDVTERSPRWYYELEIDNVEARPWVNSLARTDYYDKVSGKLSAKAFLQGTGFDGDELANTIRTDVKVSLREGKFDDPTLARLVGDESDIGADAVVMVRDNRALFRLDTPWNPSRDLLIQGYLRPLVPGPDGLRYLEGVGEATRMTAVGPRGRDMEYKDGVMPFRQSIAGILFEAQGPMGRNFSPKIRVRSVNY